MCVCMVPLMSVGLPVYWGRGGQSVNYASLVHTALRSPSRVRRSCVFKSLANLSLKLKEMPAFAVKYASMNVRTYICTQQYIVSQQSALTNAQSHICIYMLANAQVLNYF